MSADYRLAELAGALRQLGVGTGDLVYCHSNIGLFGRPDGIGSGAALCEAFFDTLMAATGGSGTLIVPTYTYSFPRREPFDPAGTASKMGIFAEWVRRHPDAQRSADPSFSVAAIGPAAAAMTADATSNSFAADSSFGRFLAADGLVLNFNFPGCTLIHQIERALHVPYRFDKSFTGELHLGDRRVAATNTIHVRYLSDDLLIHDPFPFVAEGKRRGFLAAVPLGRGEVSAIRAGDVYRLIAETLPHRPWFLTQADAKGATPHLDTRCT